jgi:hypothetical protein
MTLRIPLFILLLLIIAPTVRPQTAGAGGPPVEDQNETMIDTLKRMQIKREENEHKKILDKGAQIKLDVENLTKDASNGHLPRAGEKKLREIEKAARQIRSEFGGAGDDDPLDPKPNTLDEALKQLDDASERLNTNLSKTSRRVISVTVVEVANEITQLIKLLRGYLN